MPDPHALPPALDDQPLGEDFDRLGWFAQARRIAALRDGCNHRHTHDSAKEARRCNDLHVMQKGGVIRNLVVAPQFWFSINGVQMKHDNGRRVGMKPDFQYFEGNLNVVEDVKAAGIGGRARDYPLRKAIFRALYPFITFREV